MSRILIIPDLHQQLSTGEIMFQEGLKLNPDRVVFLGDMFDDFYDNPERSAQSAIWLSRWRERLGEKLVLLYGNHDLPYAEAAHYLEKHGSFPSDYKPNIRCSGFETAKAVAIHEAVSLSFWTPWRLHHREDGVLFTHAGADAEQEKTLDSEAEAALKSVDATDYERYSGVHPLLLPGPDRGGELHRRPGITWRDIDEFDASTNCPQVFGHSTKSAVVRFTGNSVCLDAHYNAFALLEDGKSLRIISSGVSEVKAVALPKVDQRYMKAARRHGSFLVRKSPANGRPIARGWDFTVNFPNESLIAPANLDETSARPV